MEDKYSKRDRGNHRLVKGPGGRGYCWGDLGDYRSMKMAMNVILQTVMVFAFKSEIGQRVIVAVKNGFCPLI
ncbi:hypothetical protein NPIL_525361 [Nephila pilipes]|uniref:Uncharacterized protein n=1 Tax=Nephila pilipes TaxID=299642 RepID=A0A8X6NPG9_NEPPI|nr:hypothetical protein NPIL_525361 [Nephila pilipes]